MTSFSPNSDSPVVTVPFDTLLEYQLQEIVPSVTVAVSLYNYERYIVECLDSVKAQTIEYLDLLVVDDRSSDGSADCVSNWLARNAARFARCALLRHRENSGLSCTRNTAFAQSRTNFVFVLDADNLLYPRCLNRLLLAINNCDASFAYCYLEKFGETSRLQNTRMWNPTRLREGNEIDAMVLMRRAVWEKVGGYTTSGPIRWGWEDFELWFKIARIGGWGILVPEILAKYRVHHDSMLGNRTNPHVGELWAYLKSTYPEFFQ